MSAGWLIVPAVIFLATRPKEAAAAQPTDPEAIAGVSIDINAIAEKLRSRVYTLATGRKLVVQSPAPTGGNGRTVLREMLL